MIRSDSCMDAETCSKVRVVSSALHQTVHHTFSMFATTQAMHEVNLLLLVWCWSIKQAVALCSDAVDKLAVNLHACLHQQMQRVAHTLPSASLHMHISQALPEDSSA